MQTYHGKSDTVAALTEQKKMSLIVREIGEVAGATLARAEGLTPSERQFLKDLKRNDRYTWKALTRLVLLTAKCKAAADREAFAEMLRAFSRSERARPALSVEDAIIEETKVQADCDVAEMAVMRRPNDEGALRTCEAQLLSERAAVDLALAAVQCRRLELGYAS
jgi:hypothetical protein